MASAIGKSTNFDNNFSEKTYASQIIANSLTDGIATFSNGTIVNLALPTHQQDAITKGFVDGLVNAAPPTNSVQFNNLTFGGSPNLSFIPNTLTVNGTITDGSGVNISQGIISGLNNPTNSNEIATKNYVDSVSSITTNNYIQSDIAVTYTASQMINSIILRNLQTYDVYGVSLTDTTATAAELIAFVPSATVGYAARFRIMNGNPDANGSNVEGRDRFNLTINAGTGVSFYPSTPFNLERGYMLDGYITFTDIISPAVTIIINRCTFSGATIYLVPPPSSTILALSNTIDYLNYTSMQLKGNLFWNVNDNNVTTNNYSYITSDVKNQLIIRNPTANSSDILSSAINVKYLNQIMTIQNPSSFIITINGQTDIWNLIPGPIVIPSGKQVILSLTTILPNIVNRGSYYNYGIYNTTGGSGSGMTISIFTISTTFSIINAGTNYIAANVTTTNLTTPSATGLIIDIIGTDGTGAILFIQSIINYLDGGYQNGDIIQLNGGNGDATIQLNSVNSIETYYVESIGNGEYLSTDTLTISGPGTGSDAQITLGAFILVRTIGKFLL